MAESTNNQREENLLSERVGRYREEVERLVREGIEHPRYELKREVPLTSVEDKTVFAKLVQGLANANLSEERFIIIGGDQRLKQFFPVANAPDFDPANISQLLQKYLDPPPRFEVFPSLQTAEGCPFVLLVIDARQPKPILDKCDVQAPDGRFLLHAGDIWIKADTRLRRTTRTDLDLMFRGRIEEESESRARRRFDDLRDQFLASQRFGQFSPPGLPQADLIYGDVQRFRLYALELIANGDDRRFRMLAELLRDLTVEEWHKLDAYSASGISNWADFRAEVLVHEKDKFLPAMKALVEVGLLLVKHDAEVEWLERLLEILLDVFDSSRRLSKLEALAVLNRSEALQVGRFFPATEGAIGVRTLAIYCTWRQDYAALSRILKKFVKNLVQPERSLHPFSFWPIPYGIEMREGLNVFAWQHRVQSSWGEYFGNEEAYLRAATQLEFLLEFNSWLGVSPEGKQWLVKYRPDLDMGYGPDIVNLSLSATVPLAERIYEALQRGKDDMTLVQLTVEKSLLDSRLNIVPTERPLLLAAFIDYLLLLQARIARQLGRFPFQVDWGSKLGPLLQDYRHRKEAGALPAALPFLPGLS